MTESIQISSTALDPSEFWVLLIHLFLFISNAVLMIYAVVNRDYAPIKAKQLGLVSVCFLSGWIFILGNLVAKYVLRSKEIENSCSLWLIWMFLAFGMFLWVSCVITRSWRLYCLLVTPSMKSEVTKPYWVISRVAILWVPALIYTSVLTGLDAAKPTLYNIGEGSETIYLCYTPPPYQQITLAIGIVYMLIILAFSYKLRNVRLSFNEYSGSRIAGVVMFTSVIVYGMMLFFKADNTIVGRVIASWPATITIQIYFALLIAKPALGCFIDKEGYLSKFKFEMQMDSNLKKVPSKMSNNSESAKDSNQSFSRNSSSETPAANLSSANNTTEDVENQLDVDF